jgi:hypothetical protein
LIGSEYFALIGKEDSINVKSNGTRTNQIDMTRVSRRSARLASKSSSSGDKIVKNIKAGTKLEATDEMECLERNLDEADRLDQEFPCLSDTPTSLNSFPSAFSVPDQISPPPGGQEEAQYPDPHEERRKRVHLDCEHRRRRQIAEGLFKLSQLLPKQLPRSSKMEILNSGILAIQLYEQRLANLQVQQLELPGVKQDNNDIHLND